MDRKYLTEFNNESDEENTLFKQSALYILCLLYTFLYYNNIMIKIIIKKKKKPLNKNNVTKAWKSHKNNN